MVVPYDRRADGSPDEKNVLTNFVNPWSIVPNSARW